jgi:hypothetical protein
MLEKYIMIFYEYFHAELYFLEKFCVKYFQIMKITMKNFNIFFNIWHHVLYPLTKFELKIQFIRGETKKSIRG